MIVTICKLEDLSPERREPELKKIAKKASRIFSTNSNIPTMRDAVLMALGQINVSGNSEDIEEIENRASLLK